MTKSKKKTSLYQAITREAKTNQRGKQSSSYLQFGKIIRRMRLEKKLKGVDLCQEAGDLDPRTLTALEKGRIRNPSIKTLMSVSRGLKISVSDLFKEFEWEAGNSFFIGSQKGAYQVEFKSLGVKAVSFTPFIQEFFCGKLILGPRKKLSESLLNHPFPLFAQTLVGRIEVTLSGKKISLKEGENIFFHGMLKHSFENPLQRDSVLMISTAPSFFKRG